jgi:hypothetical protein
MELVSSNKNTQIFLDYVYTIMKKHKCVLKISTDDVFIDNNAVGGYFSWTDREILIDITSNWLSTLVHEFCHLLILKETSRKENNLQYKSSDMMFSWLSKERELSKKEINFYVDVVKLMELECEKRSVEIIKQFDLPIDISTYIKQANAYVIYHEIIKKYRIWSSVPLSEMTNVMSLMSDKFDMDYINVDSKILKSFEEYLKI